MARFLAIDWDEFECCYAIGSLQGEQVNVRKAGVVPLEEYELADSIFTPLSKSVHDICKDNKIANCPVLITLGRRHTEWLQLQLPPCKTSDIPAMLKHQVLREIAGSSEFDPVDFLILDSSSEGHHVLTLTISMLFRRNLIRTFRSLGYPPLRIGFRAGNAAELVLQNLALLEGEPNEPRLLVSVVGNDADLILLADAKIAALRSFRLPDEQGTQNLADEIERTLTIGLMETGPKEVHRIVLFGTGSDSELLDRLTLLGLTVQYINPCTLPAISMPEAIEEPERFAPLLGSLLIQSLRLKPAIDFLQPKEPPKPPNYARQILLTLLLSGIVAFGLYQWNQHVLSNLEQRLTAIKQEHQQIADSIRQIQPGFNVLRQTQFWESQNTAWLDVLKELSESLPNDTELTVSQMFLTTGPINNNVRYAGMITLSGMVSDPSVLQKLQNDLQSSGKYLVQTPSPNPNPAGGGYPWLFRTNIYCLR